MPGPGGARRAEIAVAGGWFALGAAIAVGSWRMDRLADRAIEPWSAPGLTPGIVGALLMVFAAVVTLRAARDPLGAVEDTDGPDDGSTLRRTALAGALCIAFAAGLGHGVPFMALGVAFVFAFTAVFSWADWRATGRLGRGAATAFAVAVVATVAIALLFERVFLVRLP